MPGSGNPWPTSSRASAFRLSSAAWAWAVQSNWSGFGIWSAALSAAGPIYSGGGLEGNYHQRQAFWDETIATYRQKVLVAFQETSDALKAQETLPLRRTALNSQVAALRNSTDLALMRYDGGRSSYFEVLEAQQQYFQGAFDLARTERDQLLAVVNLYKALGGGWSGEPSQPGGPAQNATLSPINATMNAAPDQEASLSPAKVEITPPVALKSDQIQAEPG